MWRITVFFFSLHNGSPKVTYYNQGPVKLKNSTTLRELKLKGLATINNSERWVVGSREFI